MLAVIILKRAFLIWAPFVSFSCLTILARTSSTLLKRSDKSGHPCLFPNDIEKLSLFYHLMLCWL